MPSVTTYIDATVHVVEVETMTRMRVLREAKGLSQSALARHADLHAATVSLIETGRLRPYPGQLARIAHVLGVPADHADQLLDEVTLQDVASGPRGKQ